MTKKDIRKVVDLLIPGCWAKTTHGKDIISIDKASGTSCFQFGFMFEDFWYAEEALACRKKHLTAETNRIAKKLGVKK